MTRRYAISLILIGLVPGLAIDLLTDEIGVACAVAFGSMAIAWFGWMRPPG